MGNHLVVVGGIHLVNTRFEKEHNRQLDLDIGVILLVIPLYLVLPILAVVVDSSRFHLLDHDLRLSYRLPKNGLDRVRLIYHYDYPYPRLSRKHPLVRQG